MTSWVRQLTKAGRLEVEDVMVLTRDFNEVHRLVGVVYIVIFRGDMMAPFSFYLLASFVLEA